MRKPIIGVMGPASEDEFSEFDIKNAKKLGELIAKEKWILLTGGMNKGVMKAANEGAKSKDGTTIGILPNNDITTHLKDIDIPIITNMRSGRNYINALSSDIIIACGMGAGTASEIALGLQAEKDIILLTEMSESKVFFKKIGKNRIHLADTAEEAIKLTRGLLKR